MFPVAVSLILTMIVALVAASTLTISSMDNTGTALVTLNPALVLLALNL